MTSLLIVYINLVSFLFIPPEALALYSGFFPSIFYSIRLITCQFAHANAGHFFGNFFVSIPFLMYAESILGLSPKKLWTIWLVGGVVGGLSHSALVGGGLVGASMSICALKAYCAVSAPSRSWISLAMAFIVCSAVLWDVSSLFGPPDGVAHVGHLGGFAFGLALAAYDRWQARRRETAPVL